MSELMKKKLKEMGVSDEYIRYFTPQAEAASATRGARKTAREIILRR